MSLICIQDQDEYYQSGTFASVLFQRQIPVHIDPEVDMAYAEQCVEHFNHLSDQMIDQFCEMAIAYCENLSSQAYTRVFSANFAAHCVKNTCRATAFEAGFCSRTKECRTRMDCDRQPACVFLPCLRQNYARKSTYISCEDRF